MGSSNGPRSKSPSSAPRSDEELGADEPDGEEPAVLGSGVVRAPGPVGAGVRGAPGGAGVSGRLGLVRGPKASRGAFVRSDRPRRALRPAPVLRTSPNGLVATVIALAALVIAIVLALLMRS